MFVILTIIIFLLILFILILNNYENFAAKTAMPAGPTVGGTGVKTGVGVKPGVGVIPNNIVCKTDSSQEVSLINNKITYLTSSLEYINTKIDEILNKFNAAVAE